MAPYGGVILMIRANMAGFTGPVSSGKRQPNTDCTHLQSRRALWQFSTDGCALCGQWRTPLEAICRGNTVGCRALVHVFAAHHPVYVAAICSRPPPESAGSFVTSTPLRAHVAVFNIGFPPWFGRWRAVGRPVFMDGLR